MFSPQSAQHNYPVKTTILGGFFPPFCHSFFIFPQCLEVPVEVLLHLAGLCTKMQLCTIVALKNLDKMRRRTEEETRARHEMVDEGFPRALMTESGTRTTLCSHLSLSNPSPKNTNSTPTRMQSLHLPLLCA